MLKFALYVGLAYVLYYALAIAYDRFKQPKAKKAAANNSYQVALVEPLPQENPLETTVVGELELSAEAESSIAEKKN